MHFKPAHCEHITRSYSGTVWDSYTGCIENMARPPLSWHNDDPTTGFEGISTPELHGCLLSFQSLIIRCSLSPQSSITPPIPTLKLRILPAKMCRLCPRKGPRASNCTDPPARAVPPGSSNPPTRAPLPASVRLTPSASGSAASESSASGWAAFGASGSPASGSGRIQLQTSNQSNRSVQSQESWASIESSTSIKSITEEIRLELETTSSGTRRLEAWLHSLHPSTYVKNPNNWPPQLLTEYNTYKQLGQALGGARQAYTRKLHELRRQKTQLQFDEDEHANLANLAIAWAEAAMM